MKSKSLKTGRGVGFAVCHRLYSTCSAIPYQRSSGIVWKLQHRRKSNRTVKYADKEQTVLQGVIGRLIEIGKLSELENNVEKSEIMRISRQPSPVQIVTGQKQPENVQHFNYLRSRKTNDAISTRGGKSMTAMAKEAFNKKKALYIINPLNPELNPICYLLALLAYHFLHVSSIRVKSLTLRLLMSYIYGAPILDVSKSHTTTQHSR